MYQNYGLGALCPGERFVSHGMSFYLHSLFSSKVISGVSNITQVGLYPEIIIRLIPLYSYFFEEAEILYEFHPYIGSCYARVALRGECRLAVRIFLSQLTIYRIKVS